MSAERTHYSVDEIAGRVFRSRSTVESWINAAADDTRQRSTLLVGGVSVPVIRVGGSWLVPAAPFDAAMSGEAVA